MTFNLNECLNATTVYKCHCRNLKLDCSVLIGGNVASDLGNKELSEAVIGGYTKCLVLH